MTAPKIIVHVCHGVKSNAENLEHLRSHIQDTCCGFGVACHANTYSWASSIVESGLKLANAILRESLKHQGARRVILVGHSQGGLVCRVAAAAIKGTFKTAPADFVGPEPHKRLAKELKDWKDTNHSQCEKVDVLGVIMLATPNSGAVTYGQLSLGARIGSAAMSGLSSLVGIKNLNELTTDRLFRVFQLVTVPGVPYLSISGSLVNRHTGLSKNSVNLVPGLGKLAPYFELPNDELVEDVSVDLAYSTLPHEVVGEYEHIRRYRDCSDVSHTGIHKSWQVKKIVIQRIAEWCASSI